MASKFSITDVLALPNSPVKIPRLGFGVYLSHANQCVASCLAALKAGYRHIDSAQFAPLLAPFSADSQSRYYANEKEVGEAVRQSGLNRSDVFITTKIIHSSGSVEKTYQSLVDLFLIHTASGGSKARKEMYLALEKLLEDGKTKAIGVSNWGIGHIEELKTFAKVWPPHVNQIEVCPSSISSDMCLQDIVAPFLPTTRGCRLLPK
jgi:diketogulonate reductase-like aldo/keto reductase